MKTIKPADDAREIFAGEFYRLFAPAEENFMISPAAVMKVLFVLAQGANTTLADDILWDLAIKHVDNQFLMKEMQRLGLNDLGAFLELSQKLRDDLKYPIEQKALLAFLQKDFDELGDKVTIKNYFVNSPKYKLKAKFEEFAQDYFNFTFLPKETVKLRRSIDLRFSECLTPTELDIFGLVEFKLSFKPPIEMYEDGSLGAYGNFRYVMLQVTTGLDFHAEVIELPLESGSNSLKLTMLVFMPNELTILLKRNIGRDYKDFNEIASQLETKLIDVKLPNINLQKKYNLSKHFAEEAENGLRDCFSEPVNLARMFEKPETAEIRIGAYCQHTTLTMTAAKSAADGPIQSEKATDIIFDTRQKSFFYVIKSEKVLYVMGHFYKEK